MAATPKSLLVSILRIAGALGIIGLITVSYVRVASVNATTVALTFLLGILAIATAWGLAEAIVASVAGVLCLNYFFLPPVGTFTIADPQNWLALLVFLVTSVVASQLNARAKRRALEATRGRHEMERLYALSRNLMLTGNQPAGGHVAYQIAQVFEAPGVAFYDRSEDAVYRAGAQDVPLPDERLRDAAVQGTGFQDAATDTTIMPISLGGAPIGSLAIVGGGMSDTALHSIANLAAIELERARAQQIAAAAEAARQSDELKATLLDALAHDFKTPLTSIKAAITGLLADAAGATQRELLTVANEETDHLTSMVSEAIQMARIEAGNVRLEKSSRPVRQLVTAALEKLEPALEGRKLELDVPSQCPLVEADLELAALAIRQLLDNALKYSPPRSPITVRAREEDDSVVISVADRGPGIPETERSHIFEKFYRGHVANAIPGTGMGLAIALQIVQAHGGRIWVESRSGQGAEFFVALPSAARQVHA